MPRYKVTIDRVEYLQAVIEVEADNPYKAEDTALAEVADQDYELMNVEISDLRLEEIPCPVEKETPE